MFIKFILFIFFKWLLCWQETVPAATVVPTPVPVPVPMPTASVLATPAQPSVALTPTLEPSRDTNSPGQQHSVSDFLDDPMPHKSSPTPSVAGVMVPGTDMLDVPDTHPLRPPNPSPVESEPEGDRENTRLVSIEEFLRPELVPRTKVCLLDMNSKALAVRPCNLALLLNGHS